MEFVIGAASWALSKALASAKDTLAETWAASKGIGDNLDSLEMELLHAQWILDNPHVKQTRSLQLTELLVKLRQVAYDADDVLDELEYYRIQDDLDGTQHATDVDDDGGGLLLHARSTANAIGKRLTCCSFPSADDDPRTRVLEEDPNSRPAKGRRFFSCAWASRAQQRKHDVETQKLKFDRVDMSTKMKNIVDKLKPLCAKLTAILDTELLGSANFRLEQLGTNPLSGKSSYSTYGNAMNQATIYPNIIEPKLYVRDNQKKIIIDGIKNGEYFSDDLVVLPIVGPGGIGKTTFTQHIYNEVKGHFEVPIWLCVSLNFNASRLAQEAVKIIPEVDGENKNGSDQERIEQRLKAKRFLLVLDDMWTCHEDEWKKLLRPFGRGGEKGNVIIVTTRIPEVADMVKTVDCPIKIDRLEDKDFMDFFEACVFGHQKAWEEHPELRDVGEKILSNLKGFPLAAKTVGRVLRNQLTLDHWTRVLESKEWDLQTNESDIMPALKLSYDYLPFHLQQCFSYLAMFPEDYEFGREELIYLWMGLDILNSQNKQVEDIGLSYLIDLVDHGFLKRHENDYGYTCYVVHDLIHELAMKVQSKECIRICSSEVMSTQITPSVRHLSIIVDETDVKDRVSFERFQNDLSTLDRRLKIQNLRTLMLFGQHHGSFAKTFGDLFRNARALRTIFLHGASYAVEDILNNFSRLVHLRYLKIESLYNEDICICIPALCRLYHLHTVDLLGWKGRLSSTRSVSKLGSLRHFLVRDDAMYSGIFEVGKLKLLQELRSFEVGKESKGFELNQLEQLSELRGSLAISNLERTQTVKEAGEAKLIHKSHLRKLALEWDVNRPNRDPTHEANILEVMKPHRNLQEICIRGHGGAICPKWLGENLSVQNLESLHLDDVPWVNLPPIGEVWMVNEHGEEHLGCVPHNRFLNLRRLELSNLPRLKKWAESDLCDLFYHLKVLIITHCCELTELSFSHSICCQQQKDTKINWFPRLRELKIEDCPKLLSFPPLPWSKAPCSVKIHGVGSSLEKLVCEEDYKSEYIMEIKMKDALVSEIWNVLDFDNLTQLKELKMDTCPPLPHYNLQMLSSLKTLQLYGGSNVVFPSVECDSHAEYQFPVESIIISQWDASAKELTQLLTYFPMLSELNISLCEKITGIAVVEEQATETPAATSSDNKVGDNAEGELHQQQEGTSREEKPEGLLLLPSQLQKLWIDHCPELNLCSSPIDPNREAGRTSAEQGLQGLRSLRWLEISYCPKFLSSYASFSDLCLPFPTSLEHLSLFGTVGTATLLSLSNLTSLTDLSIKECGERGEGLGHLLTHGHLTKLSVSRTPNFFAGTQIQPSLPPSYSNLQKLWTDDIVGVLAAPICILLSSSLTELYFWGNQEVHRFTKEQEEVLNLLTSLSEIRFWECNKLQGLPGQLHRLLNLKRLYIDGCAAIRSLDRLPGSLQKLVIKDCPAIRSLHKDGLPGSLQELVIKDCPAIRSLPKVDNLPSSLLVLDVQHCNSKRLRRQCRKLAGTIPIVRV